VFHPQSGATAAEEAGDEDDPGVMMNVDATWATEDIDEGVVMLTEAPLAAAEEVQSSRQTHMCCARCQGAVGSVAVAVRLAAQEVTFAKAAAAATAAAESRRSVSGSSFDADAVAHSVGAGSCSGVGEGAEEFAYGDGRGVELFCSEQCRDMPGACWLDFSATPAAARRFAQSLTSGQHLTLQLVAAVVARALNAMRHSGTTDPQLLPSPQELTIPAARAVLEVLTGDPAPLPWR
jgi:hypothetical protein